MTVKKIQACIMACIFIISLQPCTALAAGTGHLFQAQGKNREPQSKSAVPIQYVAVHDSITFSAQDIATDTEGKKLFISGIAAQPNSDVVKASLASDIVTVTGISDGVTGIGVVVSNGAKSISIMVPIVSFTAACETNDRKYSTINAALDSVESGAYTIKLLRDIDFNGGIVVSHKAVTFDLNGFSLNISNASGAGLKVEQAGAVQLFGKGEFNVSGRGYGVGAFDRSTVEVTNVVGTGDDSVDIQADRSTVFVEGTLGGKGLMLNGKLLTLDDYVPGEGMHEEDRLYVHGTSKVYVKNRPVIMPLSPVFDKNDGTDIVLTIKTYGAKFLGIYNGTKPLEKNVDYSVVGDKVTLLASFLQTQVLGDLALTFDFSKGADPVLVVTVDDSTPIEGIPRAASVYIDGRVLLDPIPIGGKWQWDDDYFAASFDGAASFRALKTRSSDITYSYNGRSKTIRVTVFPIELPITGVNNSKMIITGLAATLTFLLAAWLLHKFTAFRNAKAAKQGQANR